MNNPTAIDLFCGCGGLSAGVSSAGFNVIAGVDMNLQYIQTFSHNFPKSASISEDLSKFSPKALMQRLKIVPEQLDLLAGGPPCQGFSKNVPRSRRMQDSENNRLIDAFLSYGEILLPKWILMENVAEIYNSFDHYYTEKIISRLEKAGYKVACGVHNAADYGVPQKRRRAFFVGRRDGISPSLPPPTHCKNGQDLLIKLNSYVQVWEAISDLRSLKNGEGVSPDGYATLPQNKFQRKARGRKRRVFNHVAKNLRPLQLKRISFLLPGQGIKNLPSDLRPKSSAYSGAYGRLTQDMVAPTITRWVFHPGSGRWGHPVDDRLITIREAARLHGFSDKFEFVGSYVQQAGQIGNAVPPLLVEKLALEFLL